jgi:nucleoside-diphosphate-sugar epimerase
MRVFVTGASGFVGSAIVKDLIAAGHKVLGLARSDESAKAVKAAGAEVHRGSLEDLDSLRSGAANADGIIHTAFTHDFNNYIPAAAADGLAIETLGTALAGSNRPLIVTSGTLLVNRQGEFALESEPENTNFPRQSERAAHKLASQGKHVSVIRLSPSVHGDGDHGFVPMLIKIAKEKGVSAYVGDGANRWSAVHRLDTARLYRLALEKNLKDGVFHGVADEAIPFKQIAEAIGRRLNIPVVSKSPEEAAEHFGWLARFVAIDGPASNKRTREQLGWQPKEVGLIADLDNGTYFDQSAKASNR